MTLKVTPIASDPDALIDEEAAARFLNVGVRFLQKHRSTGDGPPFVRVSTRCIRYRRSDLKSWSEDRLRTSTKAGQ